MRYVIYVLSASGLHLVHRANHAQPGDVLASWPYSMKLASDANDGSSAIVDGERQKIHVHNGKVLLARYQCIDLSL